MIAMDKDSTTYTEHVLALFTEVLHETMTDRPLRGLDAGITPALAQGLQFVYHHEVCSVRDVAHGLVMTLPAASQLVDRLVKKNWVTKSDNQQDRRLSEIRLTNEGRALVEQIRARRVEGMSQILGRMDPDRRQALVKSLEGFIAAVIEDPNTALKRCTHCGVEHHPHCAVKEVYLAATGTMREEA